MSKREYTNCPACNGHLYIDELEKIDEQTIKSLQSENTYIYNTDEFVYCENCGAVIEYDYFEIAVENWSQEELHTFFTNEILPEIQKQFESDGIPDKPARRESFNNWTDLLCKDGEISLYLYENVDHPDCNR